MIQLLALVGTVALQMGVQTEPPPPALASPAITALRQRISAEAERLKAELQAQETGADYTLLLRRKLTVDCTLAPLLLQEDASAFVAAVAAGREPPDLLRLLRAEFGSEPNESRWSHAGAAVHIARALQSWAAPAGGAAAWRVAAAMHQATGGDTPPYIWWTGRAEGGVPWPDVEAQACWYEPCVDTRRLDWPLSPWRLRVKWNAHDGAIGGDEGVRHSEVWPQAPRFNNPNDLYALFDLLRARNCRDMELKSASAAIAGAAPIGPSTTLSRAITRRDGTLVRREEWRFEGWRLREVHIEQPPLRVRHHYAHVFELAQEVDGSPLAAPQEVAPESELKYPAFGMSIVISFRSPDGARDALAPEYMHDDTASVPDAIQIESDGASVSRSDFGGVACGVGEDGLARVARALRIWNGGAASSANARAAAMSLAESASAHGDLPGIRVALGDANAICTADGVPADWHIHNIEVCVRLLSDAGHSAHAWELASVDWLNAMAALEHSARVRHAERAVVHGPAAVVRVALGALSDSDESVRAAVHSALDTAMHAHGPGARSLDLASDCAPPCTRPADGTSGAQLLDAIQAALMGGARSEHQRGEHQLGEHRFDRCAVAPLIISACHAISQSQMNNGARHNSSNAELFTSRAAQDLGAVITSGAGEFAAAAHGTPGDLCALCARFEARVRTALACTLPSDHEREEFRRNIRALGELARTEVERLARERGIPTSDATASGASAALAIRDFAALAGNAFHPELLHGPPAAELDAVSIATALAARQDLHAALTALDLHTARRSAGAHAFTPRMQAGEIARAVGSALRMLIQERCARTNRVGRPA